jgi:hypothetical protein
MRKEQIFALSVSLVAAFAAIAALSAHSLTENTPLFVFRMEQASNSMDFLPLEMSSFDYNTVQGFTLDQCCAGGLMPLFTLGNTCVSGCTEDATCSYTCTATCWNTCDDNTCPSSCSGTCSSTCGSSCGGTCGTCGSTCGGTCGGSCIETCPKKCSIP